uniref:Uncharacterized protein n=1 Tax=Panagrolaimus sp. PS1159 TaxID=55785 RepID=A0AC35FJF3_9BILA
MIFLLLFSSIFILPVIHGNIKDNKCDPPFVPQYLPDHEFGSYCRYSPAYSQIDFVFLLAVPNGIFTSVLQKVSIVLYNSLISHDAKFSNNSLTNNVAFIALANRALVMAPFGTLNTAEGVKNEFRKMISYRNQLNRLIALNTSAKWNFTKNFLGAEPNFFWSGKNGDQWINYSGECSLPVDYLPSSYKDPTLQGICKNTFNITAGKGAAIGSRFLCEASFEMKFIPLCETRASDSTNNPKLCPFGLKNKKHA